MSKPNCYNCINRRDLPGSAHSSCTNFTAAIEGKPHGIKSGWFWWPFNYDPVWLVKCDGFQEKSEDTP